MLDIQLGRRNLPPAQRLAVMDKFKKKIQEQANIKKEESDKQFYGNRFTGKVEPSPNGEKSKSRIHTDKELAKMAGVSTDTFKRKKILDSNNEKVKNAVLSGEMSINAGYKN